VRIDPRLNAAFQVMGPGGATGFIPGVGWIDRDWQPVAPEATPEQRAQFDAGVWIRDGTKITSPQAQNYLQAASTGAVPPVTGPPTQMAPPAQQQPVGAPLGAMPMTSFLQPRAQQEQPYWQMHPTPPEQQTPRQAPLPKAPAPKQMAQPIKSPQLQSKPPQVVSAPRQKAKNPQKPNPVVFRG
jgi:hypothetical protein